MILSKFYTLCYLLTFLILKPPLFILDRCVTIQYMDRPRDFEYTELYNSITVTIMIIKFLSNIYFFMKTYLNFYITYFFGGLWEFYRDKQTNEFLMIPLGLQPQNIVFSENNRTFYRKHIFAEYIYINETKIIQNLVKLNEKSLPIQFAIHQTHNSNRFEKLMIIKVHPWFAKPDERLLIFDLFRFGLNFCKKFNVIGHNEKYRVSIYYGYG